MSEIDDSNLRLARRIVEAACGLLVISGAGMSAECGIQTFRRPGDDGAWDQAAQQLATPEGFQREPQHVWSWYRRRRLQALAAQPHAGYTALASWEQRAPVFVVTQNVDGLHARAGSSRVVELHGSLHRFKCAAQSHAITDGCDQDVVPRCSICGSYVRPAVVWFGEYVPDAAISGAAEALEAAQAVLLVGTSLVVNTPGGLLRSAARRGLPIIEVNPDPALPRPADAQVSGHLPPATTVLAGPAGVVLPRLLA
ncbi:MAG TPA: Sir2 family NAD-dependent protein deacetylase [Chloroflexota bacterium]|nr:Sir2 family NAD-dependent protein deacetylase [Chloroflexota bacterium]